MVVCLERGADLHIAQPMPLPLTVSCFSKIQIRFTFLVPAHLGSPGQRAVKCVCVCVCVCVLPGEGVGHGRDVDSRDQREIAPGRQANERLLGGVADDRANPEQPAVDSLDRHAQPLKHVVVQRIQPICVDIQCIQCICLLCIG